MLSVLGRVALAAITLSSLASARAPSDGTDRQAVMAVLALGGETAPLRDVRVHDFERGASDDSRVVCGEVWFDGTLD